MYHIVDRDILVPLDIDISTPDGSDIPLSHCMEWMRQNKKRCVQIVGEGGMEKTSSLIEMWKELVENPSDNKPIALMIPLHEANREESIKNFIINYLARKLFYGRERLTRTEIENVIDEMNLSNGREFPPYLLLLDGFNEVNKNLSNELAEEIVTLMKYENMAVIMTSRHEIDSYFHFRAAELTKLELKELDDTRIEKYLQQHKKSDPETKTEWELLRNPMMLSIYCNTNIEANTYVKVRYFMYRYPIKTKGELINNYLESLVSKNYKTHNRRDKLVCDLLVMHYYLPYIAHYLELKSIFELSEEDMLEQIYKAHSFISNNKNFLEKFFKDRVLLTEWTINKVNAEEIFFYFKAYPSIFRSKADKWSFTHQNYRDYLSANYILLVCKMRIYNKETEFNSLNKKISINVLKIIAELENYNPCFLNDVLELLRKNTGSNYKMILYNAMQIWRYSGETINGKDFSALDLQGLFLCPYLKKPYSDISTKFDNSKIYYSNFFLEGHESNIYHVKYNQDGSLLATGSSDSTAIIWDSETGEKLHTLIGHKGEINSIDFSPDGQKILTASADGVAIIWNLEDGKPMQYFKHSKREDHSYEELTAEYSIDGQLILTRDDQLCYVWSVEKNKKIHFFREKNTPLCADEIKYSPNKRYILEVNFSQLTVWDAINGEKLKVLDGCSFGKGYFSMDENYIFTCIINELYVWDWRNNTILHKLEGHNDYISDLDCSLDNNFIVTSSKDETAIIWDIINGKMIHRLVGHKGYVYKASFSPNGKYVITASGDQTACIWDTTSGQMLHRLEGHTDRVYDARFSPNSQRVATVSDDTALRIWNVENGEMIHCVQGKKVLICDANYSPSEKYLATVTDNGFLILWNISNGKMLYKLKAHNNLINTVEFSPSSQIILTSSYDKTAKVWKANEGKRLYCLDDDFVVESAQFSPDGQTIVTCNGHLVKIWNAHNGAMLHYFKSNDYNHESVQFSSDGQHIVTSSDDYKVRIFDTESGELCHCLDGLKCLIECVEYSPSGNFIIAAAGSDILVWDVTHGKVLKKLKHFGGVNIAKFSPNESLVLTGTNKECCIWDIRNETTIRFLRGHSDEIRTANFSPNGEFIVTSSYDSTVRVWDVKSGTELHCLQGHNGWVYKAVFSRNSNSVMTFCSDESAMIWDLSDILHPMIFDHRFNKDLLGCTFNNAIFDNSLSNRDIALLQKYEF